MKFQFIIVALILFGLSIFAQEDYFETYNYNSIDFQLLSEIETGDTSVIKQLILKGANINISTSEGVTPIMYSVLFDKKDVTKMLLYYGADADKAAYDGKTSLILAAEQDQIEIGEMLILNKASLTKKDNQGYSAIHYAIINGNYNFTDMLLFYEVNIEETSKDGSTPLLLASYYGYNNIVELLLMDGADFNASDKKGYTSLMVAAQNGNYETVELLLNYGADTEIKNTYHHTALCFAVKNGYKDIAELLTDFGADYKISFSEGYNLLYLADIYNKYEIKKWLKEKGLKEKTPFYFDMISLNGGMNFSDRDAVFESTIGMKESRTNLNVGMTYMIRLGNVPVIERENEIILQLNENRSFIGLNIDKDIRLIKITNLTNIGLKLSVREMFTYGNIIGMKRNARGGFVFNPSAGIYYRKSGFFVYAQYQYLNTHVEEFPTGRISFNIGYDFLIKKALIRDKKIKVIENDDD